jgi:hypothetical protein
MTLFGYEYFFFIIALSISFLNVVLKGLKHDTSKGCSVCDIHFKNVTIFNPNVCASFISCEVT